MSTRDRDVDAEGLDLPLSGLRVLDAVDGQLQSVGRVLADLGADVLRLEKPGGSIARTSGKVVDGESVTFAVRNANKRGIVIDLTTDKGMAEFDDLVLSAAIVIHDRNVGSAEEGAFDATRIRALSPSTIVVSLTDFGRSGPKRGWTGTPDVHFAMSTILSRSGLPNVAEPLLPPAFLAYESAAAQAVWCVLLAYYNRVRTGRGDSVDFSVSEALIQIFDPPFGVGGSARAGASLKDVPRTRPDARHFYPIFRSLDGWVRICVLSKRQWRGMFEWLGRPEEFADPKYDNTRVRFAAAGTLYPLIGEMFKRLTSTAIVEAGQSRGVPTAELLDASGVMAAEGYQGTGSFTSLALAGNVDMTVPNGIFEIDDARAGIRFPARPIKGDRNAVQFLPPAGFSLPPADHRPFDGLRVLDLGVIVVGAELGRLFGDYGADVIKIESNAFPDGSRGSAVESEMSESLAYGQRNKRSVGLNLRSEMGKDVFADLIAASDVVLTNFKPGTLASLGFDFDRLRQLNPAIILSESSAFGNNGPWSRRLGYGPLVRASAGLSGLWRYPEIDGSFSDAITIYPDHSVARFNAAAIVALLLRRARTGRGGRVSTAQVDAIFFGMADQLAVESIRPGTVRAEGNHRGGDSPRGVFAAAGADEWVVVDVTSTSQFRALAKVIGEPEWLHDDRLATAAGRVAAEAAISPVVGSWIAARSPKEAEALLQEAGVPAGHMARPADILSDSHLSARKAFGEFSQPQLDGDLPTNLSEARFGELPLPRLNPAPLLAEQTRQVLKEWIGMRDETIDELLASGALEEHPTLAQRV